MENKSNSLLNITTINSKHQKSSSLPNLPTGEDSCCCSPPCSSSASKRLGNLWTRNPRVIPAILQKTWNKIKSMNKKRPTNSAPPTPNSLMKFDFDDDGPPPPPLPEEDHHLHLLHHRAIEVEEEEEENRSEIMDDPVQEKYAKLQKRLSEELHQGQIQIAGGGGKNKKSGYCVSGEFKKKLQQWEMWKVSCGKVTYTDEELKQILPEDFSKKLEKWETIRSSPSSSTTNVKIEKQIQWLERQLEKIELEKGKLETQMRKFLEKEARLEKMREALKNYPRDQHHQVLIKTNTAEGLVAAGVDEKFTQKLYEWEELRGIPAEDGSMALLNPKYYVSVSSNSSEPPESEDIQEPPLGDTPVSSSSLESINQASGSNASSADIFYQKSRRRSSSLSLNRSPSLSAFTSDDEDNAGLLKTVQEEDVDDKFLEPPPNPVVRVNQIVVEEEDDDEQPLQSHLIVATRRTLIKPIETEQPPPPPRPIQIITGSASASSSTLKDLSSPSLVKHINIGSSSSSNNNNTKDHPHHHHHHVTAISSSSSPTTSKMPCSPSPSTSPKMHVEDIWNKNVDTSPPPIREGPKVVGFIPKLPPLPLPPPSHPPVMSSAFSSSTSIFNSMSTSPSSSTITMTTSTAKAASGSSVTATTAVSNLRTFETTAVPGFSGLFGQQKSLLGGSSNSGSGGGCDSLRNFPRMGMGKHPVWISPLVARRRMNSASSFTSTTSSSTDKTLQQQQQQQQQRTNEFSLDRFLEHRNLSSAVSASSVGMLGTRNSSGKYTFGGGFPPQHQEQDEGRPRLIGLSRSSSFGLGKLHASPTQDDDDDDHHHHHHQHHHFVPADRTTMTTEATGTNLVATNTNMNLPPPAAKVVKSKSTSSVLKSGLNLFSKVRKSENLTNNHSNNNEPVKPTKARWFLNKF